MKTASTLRQRVTRVPVATLAVFGLTAVPSLLQVPFHSLLTTLERTPAGLHGDWWRTFTSLFVQDGGISGTLSNLGFLLLIGAIAEQVTSRSRWLLAYFATGLAGELVGYAWQPRGGGNSVAICGLAGMLVVALWIDDPRLPGFSDTALLYWCGALLGTITPVLTIIGVGIAGFAAARERRSSSAKRPVALAALATSVALTIAQNIHGAALLTGIAISAGMQSSSQSRTKGHHGNLQSRDRDQPSAG